MGNDNVERCDSCSKPINLIWATNNETWEEYNGAVRGHLCPKCFEQLVGKTGGAAVFLAVELTPEEIKKEVHTKMDHGFTAYAAFVTSAVDKFLSTLVVQDTSEEPEE